MTTKNIGSEGFVWFIGVVEDRNDPLKIGRVKLRIHGLHGNQVATSKEHLPWAPVLMPAYSASLLQVGQSPTGLQVGSTVIGFFMDGNESNMPIVIGSLAATNDLSKLAIEQMSLNKSITGNEPSSAYKSKYPYNKVFQSEAGHVVEIDDTPGEERIHVYHKTGTYTEVNKEGRRVAKTVGDDYDVVVKDKNIYVEGNMTITVKGNLDINVDGNVRINGSTINLNRGTQGAARIGDAVPDSELDGTQGIGEGSSTVFIGD